MVKVCLHNLTLSIGLHLFAAFAHSFKCVHAQLRNYRKCFVGGVAVAVTTATLLIVVDIFLVRRCK